MPHNLATDEPVLLFGGPYSNLEATQALLDEAARRKIPASNIICTGDVVAYCADARETVALLKESSVVVIMGNCEEQLSENAEDCGCGFEEGSTCDVLAEQWYAYANAQLDDEDRAWMRALPRQVILNIAGIRLLVVHGSVSAIARFVFNSTPPADLLDEIILSDCDGVVGGHCGLPFTRIMNDKLWHNPGVIGMPANDGTARVWYSTLTPVDGGIEIAHHELTYYSAVAAQKMRERKLPAGYADCLASGLWPSLDVLPKAEKQLTGQPIEFNAPLRFSR